MSGILCMKNHPHSLVRAYAAVAMGVAGSINETLSGAAEACHIVAIRELLSYEALYLMLARLSPFLESNLK